ncbi:MAG: hypothetical protein U1E53_34055 [Dongiaceae bacterium]
MLKPAFTLAFALLLAAGLATTAEARGKRHVPHGTTAGHAAAAGAASSAMAEGTIVVARRIGKR